MYENEKEVQKIILPIFSEFIRIAKKYNLRYFAMDGTLLGAVRHQGFIPWDDDLDIAMPNKDYDIFLKIVEKELPENLKLFLSYKKKHGTLFFAKIIDENTTFIEKHEMDYSDCYKGCFIDIFPIYGVPNSALYRYLFFSKIKLYLRLNRMARLKFEDFNECNNIKNSIKCFVWSIIHSISSKFMSVDLWNKRILSLMRKYDFDDSEYLGYVWSYNLDKYVFNKEWCNKTIDMSFEGMNIKCPIDYNLYLSKIYGNYMELPPVEQRVSGHNAYIDINSSYKNWREQ